jgi:hypothetical protein
MARLKPSRRITYAFGLCLLSSPTIVIGPNHVCHLSFKLCIQKIPCVVRDKLHMVEVQPLA